MKLKLVKIKGLSDPFNLFNIEEERTEIQNVDRFERPKLGEMFTLIGMTNWFSTSIVQEILSDEPDRGTFKTHNSFYKWEILEK